MDGRLITTACDRQPHAVFQNEAYVSGTIDLTVDVDFMIDIIPAFRKLTVSHPQHLIIGGELLLSVFIHVGNGILKFRTDRDVLGRHLEGIGAVLMLRDRNSAVIDRHALYAVTSIGVDGEKYGIVVMRGRSILCFSDRYGSQHRSRAW